MCIYICYMCYINHTCVFHWKLISGYYLYFNGPVSLKKKLARGFNLKHSRSHIVLDSQCISSQAVQMKMSETSQKQAWQNLPPTSKWRLFELTCLRCNGMPWQHIPSKIRWRIIIRISTWCADWNEQMTARDPKHINYSFGILNQKETQTELYVKGTSRMDPLGAKLKRLDLSKKANEKMASPAAPWEEFKSTENPPTSSPCLCKKGSL